MEVKPEQPRLVRGDDARVNVAATYFWGGPVRRAKVSYHVTRQPDYVGPPSDDDDLSGYYPRRGRAKGMRGKRSATKWPPARRPRMMPAAPRCGFRPGCRPTIPRTIATPSAWT